MLSYWRMLVKQIDVDHQSLMDSLGMAAMLLNRRMMIHSFNDKARSLFGDEALTLEGKLVDQLLAPSVNGSSGDRSALITLIDGLVGNEPAETQLALSRTDGSVFIARVIVSVLNTRSGKQGYWLLIEDVTPLKNELQKLALSAQVFEHSGESIMITDTLDRIVRINHAFTHFTGYDESDVLGRTPEFLREGLGEESIYQGMWEEVARSNYWSGEVFNRMKSGGAFPSWLSITRIDKGINAGHHISIFSDISSHLHEVKKIRHQAHHDFLTGLPNRALLIDRLRQSVTRQKRRQAQLMAVLFIDLDGFKSLNDQLGHAAGDQFLKDVAHAFTACVREEDTICRYGGDEFVILLAELKSEQAAAEVSEKLLRSVSEVSTNNARKITASIGIAMFPRHGRDAESLIGLADRAMYSAKSCGKNGYRLYQS